LLSLLPTTAFAIAAFSSGSTAPALPAEVHPSVTKAFQQAIDAEADKDFQLSLALMHGILYNSGVKIRLKTANGKPITKAAEQGLDKALEVWQDVLGRDNPIKLVDGGQDSDLTIQFVDKVPTKSYDTLGLIEMRKEYSWNRSRYEVKVSGTIYIQTNYEGKNLNAAQYTEVIAHELGHLLGLNDLANTGQLMGPMVFEKPISGPLAHESNAVQIVRYQAKRQWNSVIDKMNSEPTTFNSNEIQSCIEKYLATCTVGRPCQQGKTKVGDLGGTQNGQINKLCNGFNPGRFAAP